MYRKINFSALLCLLILGLCEAYWYIEDDWMRDAPPASIHEIRAKANKSLSAIRQEEIVIAKSKQKHDQILARAMQDLAAVEIRFQQKFKQPFTSEAEKTEFTMLRRSLDEEYNQVRQTVTSHISQLGVLSSVLEQKKADLHHRLNQSYCDIEQGINRKSRLEVYYPGVNINLNLPHGSTAVHFRDSDRKSENQSIWFRLQVDTGDIFKFDLQATGSLPKERFAFDDSGGSYKQGYLLPGGSFSFHDYANVTNTPLYEVELMYNGLMKKVRSLINDPTSPNEQLWEQYQTTYFLDRDIFLEETRRFLHISGSWIQTAQSSNWFDLNTSAEVLKGPCQNSLTIENVENDRIISKKQFHC